MEKIVSKAIKIDLHIHSCFSAGKDADKVKQNTLDNLNVLIDGLTKNNVNVAAITDHDTFNYQLYYELKKQEENGNCIQKILPGIEFSVEFNLGKQIHVVVIFDDKDNEKVKNIETIMTIGSGKTKYHKSKQQFSRRDFIDILDEMGLNFIMIAHQKKSILSKDGAKENDVLSLGREAFNELVFMDYFDAFEFRNKKNELYNKIFQINNSLGENVRFITGSDCHKWENYPYTEKDEKQNFNYTFLKSLPSFKGLAMAITDNHRIAYENKFFNPLETCIQSFHVKIRGKEQIVPLSKGINVIIGDNSIGKSLFVHRITGNLKLGDKQIEKGYKKYLEKKNIELEPQISEDDIFMFNTQGEIRSIFDKGGLKPDAYLKQFYPNEINASKYRKIVETELESLYSALEAKFRFDEHKSSIPGFTITSAEYVPMNLTFIGKKNKISDNQIKNLIDKLDSIYKELEDVRKNKEMDHKDSEQISRTQETLLYIKEKYQKKHESIKSGNEKINAYVTFINEYEQAFSKRITDEQALYSDYITGKAKAIETIANLIIERTKLIEYNSRHINEEIVPETNPVDRYKFVSKLGIERVDKNYIDGLIKGVLKKGANINTLSITEKELAGYIKNNNAEGENSIDVLKDKIKAVLDKDFATRNSIIESGMDVYQEVSSGFDAQMYFTLISGETSSKGIYIIDQPEDHISQKAIKEKVLNQFRRMGENRQVIMVTHNPQFIINLDVDNVIFLSDENGEFCIKSGALEYENADYSILDIVAENVEGGLAQIQGRLKRYEKKLYTK